MPSSFLTSTVGRRPAMQKYSATCHATSASWVKASSHLTNSEGATIRSNPSPCSTHIFIFLQLSNSHLLSLKHPARKVFMFRPQLMKPLQGTINKWKKYACTSTSMAMTNQAFPALLCCPKASGEILLALRLFVSTGIWSPHSILNCHRLDAFGMP